MRKLLPVLSFVALFAVSLPTPAGDKKDFFFRDGDAIVIMGDSITEQLLYSNYVEMWTVSRFPQWKLTFRNVGIGGDRSTGGNSRFKRDVLAHGATALTVDFGMNDGNYKAFDEKTFNIYMKGLQGIADQAKAAKIRVAWITPQPVEHTPGDKKEVYNETLEKFGDGVKAAALANDGLFVDQFHPYWEVIKKARDGGEKGRITAGDAVHPGPPGQVVMAASILKGLRFPSLVSNAVIVDDGKTPRAGSAENCKITDVKRSEGGIEFTRHDQALPFFPAEAKGILKWSPILEEMNVLRLHVTGLKAMVKYAVRFDDTPVGTFSGEELGRGVNLAAAALEKGPVAEQVNKLWKAVKDKNKYFHDEIFRGLVLASPKSPVFKDVDPKEIEQKRQELYEARMKLMPVREAAVREALVTRPYRVSINETKD